MSMLHSLLAGLIAWAGDTGLHNFMVKYPLPFVVCQTLHFMGLSVLLGALMLIDLRGLGVFPSAPLKVAHKLVPLAIGGFAVQLVTGLCMTFTNPTTYLVSQAFWAKMVLIGLAGLNALAYEVFVFRPLETGNTAIEGSAMLKITSALSLVLWVAVLVAGRLIAYI
jgi:hypothetical protein